MKSWCLGTSGIGLGRKPSCHVQCSCNVSVCCFSRGFDESILWVYLNLLELEMVGFLGSFTTFIEREITWLVAEPVMLLITVTCLIVSVFFFEKLERFCGSICCEETPFRFIEFSLIKSKLLWKLSFKGGFFLKLNFTKNKLFFNLSSWKLGIL